MNIYDLGLGVSVYNIYAKGGKKPDWDPTNPYHIHTESGQKVSFTPEAYAALPDNMKRQVDEHAVAMNTFENQYMVNPEYAEFRERMEAARTAENVAASRGEYWDRNWYDPNYKSGAYAFDDNGLMTFQGQTYAPFGDSSQQGIVVPMRTPNGMSYGANIVYYPVTVPEQYIPRTTKPVYAQVEKEKVDQVVEDARQQYIKTNTKYYTPYFGGMYYDPVKDELVYLNEYEKRYPYKGYRKTDRNTGWELYGDAYNNPYLNEEQFFRGVDKIIKVNPRIFINRANYIHNYPGEYLNRKQPSREEVDANVKIELKDLYPY